MKWPQFMATPGVTGLNGPADGSKTDSHSRS
jgi:hypothetical protein